MVLSPKAAAKFELELLLNRATSGALKELVKYNSSNLFSHLQRQKSFITLRTRPNVINFFTAAMVENQPQTKH
jgi:hypothetical protein